MTAEHIIAPSGSRAILYLRVSTGQQAKNDLSIPDQRKQLKSYCKNHAYIISGEYKDAKSGRTDNRHGFQAMMDDILHGGLECDLIVVHSYSRFFRDEVISELYMRDLAKRGVLVVSLTQRTDDSLEGKFLRRILAIFDEYQSLQTAKHVRRAHHENALQGHWNGGVTPFGYKLIVSERRGKTEKKSLAIEEADAELVRKMFKLARTGDEGTGPMGVKAITSWLNDRGYRTRRRKMWGVSGVHRTLTNRSYTGTFIYHSGERNGVEIPLEIPALINEADFDAVQNILSIRNPKKTPPRTITGDVLLTGILTCPNCGSGMTTATGKSGRYRYYKCSQTIRVGKTGCPGRTVPMEGLDDIVTRFLEDHFFEPESIRNLLAPLEDQQKKKATEFSSQIAERENALLKAKKNHDQHYKMIENDLVDMTDADFKCRFQASKEKLTQARKELSQLSQYFPADVKATQEKIQNIAQSMRDILANTPIRERRGYIRAVIDEIRVGSDSLQIFGRRSQLSRFVAVGKPVPSPVPTFVRKWRSG